MSNLKYVRIKRGYSQGKLAELSGISVRVIQSYEQGHRDINLAQAITVHKLAQALRCNIEELLEFNLCDDLTKPVDTELSKRMKNVYEENKHLFFNEKDGQ